MKKAGHVVRLLSWLGWRDSNPRMLGPKPSALPLGDTLILVLLSASFVSFRTNI